MKLTFNGPVMEEIYQKLKEHDIEFDLSLKDEEIQVHGFSKSGVATLKEDEEGNVVAHTRYGQENKLSSFEDLVRLNYEWFDMYRDRKPFTSPSSDWADVLVEYGYVKRTEKVVVKYE